MIPDGKCEFIETDATVSSFLATQEDELFVPGVEETVNFDVEYLPP